MEKVFNAEEIKAYAKEYVKTLQKEDGWERILKHLRKVHAVDEALAHNLFSFTEDIYHSIGNNEERKLMEFKYRLGLNDIIFVTTGMPNDYLAKREKLQDKYPQFVAQIDLKYQFSHISSAEKQVS